MKNILLITALIFAGFTANAQFTLIPDTNFEKALIGLGYDSGPLDNRVPTANINTITFLDVFGKSIVDLTGIEDFTALDTLYCHRNSIDTLDLSRNLALTRLSCGTNVLDTLNVTNNVALTRLYCRDNQLGTLDVSNNTILTLLDCGENNLEKLDLSLNTSLVSLFFDNNQLYCLNVRNGYNTSISNANFLAINNPNLTCIEVDDTTYSITYWTNIDAGVTFSTNCNNACSPVTLVPDTNFEKALIGLGHDFGPLDGEVLTASISSITFLDVSDTNIVDLKGIEDFTALDTLYCDNNKLDTLDLSRNTALTVLYCGYNQLSKLDLSKNTALTSLSCDTNKLSCLNMKNGNNINMPNANFKADGNSLTCIEVDDPTTTSWTNIDPGVTFSASCYSSCVSGLPNTITEQALENISVYPNPTSGEITIGLGEIQEQLSSTLYNNLGQVVFTQFFVNTTKIDLSIEAPSGIYFLQLTTPTTTKTIKVLKE